jgi:predicted amidohydrolase YtcJ
MSTDLLVLNARIWTADPQRLHAEALALAGNRIVAVGSDAELAALRGSAGRVIDAGGATMLPGLIDSHYHLMLGSLRLAGIQLGAVDTYQQLREQVLAYAAAHPDQPWLAGYGLPYGRAAHPGELNRQDLDAIIADRPLLVTAFDGHTAWANTRALQLGGVLHGADCGPNSEVVMAEDGLAAGELREPGAFGRLRALIPKPDAAERRRLLRLGLRQAAEQGLTSVHNMDGSMRLLEELQAAEQADELTLRVYLPYDITPATEIAQIDEAVQMRARANGPRLRAGAVKFFMDGVIEGYTGLLLAPYGDQPGTLGDANFTPEQFNQLAIEADRLGLQIFVHAIGDLAVRRTLDGFAAAQQANGMRDSRHRVEHIELIDDADLPRFAQIGALASMQPYHAPIPPDYGAVWLSRAGVQRWNRSFAWRSIRDAGAHLAFGSDWPVVTQNPWVGLAAAIERQAWAAHAPSQALTLSEALHAYTTGGAYAEFQEQSKGMLRPGMFADLTLLDRDLFADPSTIATTRVHLTICDGQIVYEG